MYATTLLCTGISRPPLEFSPPIPIEIESALGELVGAAPFGPSSRYGCGASTLEQVVRRNYEPHRQGWRITGFLDGRYAAQGYTESPGEIDGDNPIIFPPEPLITPFIIEIDSGPPGVSPVVRPEFAIVPRVVAEVTFDKTYVNESFFPIGRGDEGELMGCYLVTTFRITAELLPYSWDHAGAYYLEHDIKVEMIGNDLQFPLGGENFTFDESVVADPGGNVYSRLEGPNIKTSGSIVVRDPLMGTFVNWGSISFWGNSDTTPQGLLSPRLNLQCSVHYLPSPDL